MKKWTLQLITLFLLTISVSLASCNDADYEEYEGGDGKPAISLEGTSWQLIEQGVKIVPTDDAPSDYKTTTGTINKFFADRLKIETAIQTFDKYSYEVTYSVNGEDIAYEMYSYTLANDSITQNDGFTTEDEKGVALVAGNILTIRVNITSSKLTAILMDSSIDPNLNDAHVKEIIYQIRGKKISE
ncbi:hypothetical protein [Dysgonomonas massiliensis]|uniref:hypothetical protein n=1 Tax=Dysgonomonas massiliensis TaxID=2040292 RepID=UPI000C793741|nr:hypothetical protein [Dysgonomonas massiliensis]